LPTGHPVRSATPGGKWQEQEPGQGPGGPPQPRTNRSPSCREGRPVGRFEQLHTASRGRGFADDQQTANLSARPPPIAGDLRCESGFAVQRRDHRLRVRHHRLDLDHEHGRGRSVERQDVDGPALATDSERGLDSRLPARTIEPLENRLDEHRMSRVEQSVETLAMPPNGDVQRTAKGLDKRLPAFEAGPSRSGPTPLWRRAAGRCRPHPPRPADAIVGGCATPGRSDRSASSPPVNDDGAHVSGDQRMPRAHGAVPLSGGEVLPQGKQPVGVEDRHDRPEPDDQCRTAQQALAPGDAERD
jgi:hypothetical protein